MRDVRVFLLVGTILIFVAGPLSATPAPASLPPYNQCPTVGMAQSCAYLLVLGSGGSLNLLFDPNVKDVDTNEMILVGVQNNSGYSIPSFTWDGISFPGLANGAHTYLELKDSFDYGELGDSGKGDDQPTTPEPTSLALLGTGLVVLCLILRRRAVRIPRPY